MIFIVVIIIIVKIISIMIVRTQASSRRRAGCPAAMRGRGGGRLRGLVAGPVRREELGNSGSSTRAGYGEFPNSVKSGLRTLSCVNSWYADRL